MDWSVYDIEFTGEGRRRVNLFSYLLSYSRRQYLCFTERQDFDTTVREHIRAFEYLPGVAATCLYDNMKVVVTRWEDDQPVYNTRFLAFATHYGFRPWACRPRRPETKGKVEKAFSYASSPESVGAIRTTNAVWAYFPGDSRPLAGLDMWRSHGLRKIGQFRVVMAVRSSPFFVPFVR